MITALPIPPQGQWNDTHDYQLCTKPPGDVTGTSRTDGLSTKGWVQDTFLGGAPRRQYIRFVHLPTGTVLWAKLLPR